eukprot:scaffold203789_cov21-Tisochrysis_lutea.AAC.1
MRPHAFTLEGANEWEGNNSSTSLKDDFQLLGKSTGKHAITYVYNKANTQSSCTCQERPRSGRARFYMLTAATLAHDKQDVWAMETVVMEMRAGFDGRW